MWSDLIDSKMCPIKKKKKMSLGDFDLGVESVLCPLNRKPRITWTNNITGL